MLIFTVAANAQEQAGSIRGVVTDQEFSVPLGGARVEIVETGERVETAEDGGYRFSEVAPGQYTLIFSRQDYQRQIRPNVTVTAGELTDVDVELPGDFTEMEEFVVQDILQLGGGSEAGLLDLRFESPALMDSISAELMSQAGASDAASALRLVSGATVSDDGKSAVVRGLPDRYVSSQLNGIVLPSSDDDKRAVELDQFPAVVLESIQVTKTFTPDQQGNASGGAVDVRLKGIPQEPFFFKVKGQVGYNSQTGGRDDFLSYEGGGLTAFGRDNGSRRIQNNNIGSNWEGAVGVSEAEAPLDYKWSASSGGRFQLGEDVAVGGSVSYFYERDSQYYDDGVDDSLYVRDQGQGLAPERFQDGGPDDFLTQLFDIEQGSQSVQWGTLGTFGIEVTEDHRIDATYLYSRTAEDKATLAEDTRGKEFFFPGHDPNDPTTPGHAEERQAPYLRVETLDYTERVTETLQFHGEHRLPLWDNDVFLAPEWDWTIAMSSASLDQPDKRQFGSRWIPGRVAGGINVPPLHQQFKPAAQATLGNLQRIYKKIDEESFTTTTNLKFPFQQWDGEEGFLKVGFYRDDVDRTFLQETFSNFANPSSLQAPFETLWSGVFPFTNQPVGEALIDVDYTGDITIWAYYAMLDLPLTPWATLIGGARFESTEIGIVNDPEADARWFPEGSTVGALFTDPSLTDAKRDRDDWMPAIALTLEPLEDVTIRLSYAETIARQTFKEITPIIQQEFLGGPIFIGNPNLNASELENYDVRIDYTPYDGGLVSASWFYKDISQPIEYVQRPSNIGSFTFPRNYPDGRLQGVELETRQDIGHFWDALEGLSVGANGTYIDSEVTLPQDEVQESITAGAPLFKRDATNAPEYLYNLFATYDLAVTDTQFGLFYTVQGDTLVTGADTTGFFVPSVYRAEFDSLNASVTQGLGEWVTLQFQAKNLTNPNIKDIYRSPYIGEDVTNVSFTRGIDYSVSIGGEINF